MRGSSLEDELAREVRDVEQHAAVGGAAALEDLRVVRQRDPVAGGELAALGVVALHEALPVRVAQDAALAAHGLGHEGARGVLRRDHAGRVELHELHVLELAAGLQREAHALAEVLVAARGGAAVDPRVAARGQDDGVGVDDVGRARLDVEAVRAEDAAARLEQAGDDQPVVEVDRQLHRPAHERPLHLATRVVAGEAGAAVLVRPEEALGEPAVLLVVEARAPALELLDGLRRALDELVDDPRVPEPVPLGERVRRVLRRGVLRVHRAERCVDAARGEDRVGVLP